MLRRSLKMMAEKQEALVQQWAEAKYLWIPNSEQILVKSFGSKIAQGAEAKVYV
ncbi:MAG: hypothetical protein MJ003_05585 [Paludibacteraceae bacterium]|nr:hypothetical protein [Paludibacteraceae bacterium]